MRVYHVGNWLEATIQHCKSEFGLGLWLSVLDGHHLTFGILVGSLTASADVWFPVAEEAV